MTGSKSTFDKVILLGQSNTMKVTQKGQVTIPKRFRDRFLLKTNSKVVFEEKEDGILIKPVKNTDVETIMSKIEKCAGIADVNMTTDQIINLTRD